MLEVCRALEGLAIPFASDEDKRRVDFVAEVFGITPNRLMNELGQATFNTNRAGPLFGETVYYAVFEWALQVVNAALTVPAEGIPGITVSVLQIPGVGPKDFAG